MAGNFREAGDIDCYWGSRLCIYLWYAHVQGWKELSPHAPPLGRVCGEYRRGETLGPRIRCGKVHSSHAQLCKSEILLFFHASQLTLQLRDVPQL